MRFVVGLTCHECGTRYEPKASYVCSDSFGPLEVSYDYDASRRVMTRQLIESRPPSIWRYRELLPLPPEIEPVSLGGGGTLLLRSLRFGNDLGLAELWIKDGEGTMLAESHSRIRSAQTL